MDLISPVNGQTYYHPYLLLLSDSLPLDGEEIIGRGDFLNLEINCSSINLEPGTYNFTGLDQNSKVFDFEAGGVIINYALGDGAEDILVFTQGKITVSKSGNTLYH